MRLLDRERSEIGIEWPKSCWQGEDLEKKVPAKKKEDATVVDEHPFSTSRKYQRRRQRGLTQGK